MELKQRTIIEDSNDTADDLQKDLFSTEEIQIEEMAIDGICGVY